jgi:hypothetical protein
MDSFPNLPPAKSPAAGGPVPAYSGPAVADAPPPPRSDEPAQVPLHLSDGKEEGDFILDSEFMESYLDDRNPLPAMVLGIGVLMCYGIFGGFGFWASGVTGAISMSIMLSVMLAVACATSAGAGWLVCKVFNDDIGSVVTHFVRFSSIAAFQIAVFSGLILLLGVFPAVVISLPIMVGIVVFVGGMDLFRAIVFSVLLTIVNIMLASFFMMSAIATTVGEPI